MILKVSMRNRIFGIQNADCGMRNLKGEIGNNGLIEWWKAPANAIVLCWKGDL